MRKPNSRVRRRPSNATTAYWPIAAMISEPPANSVSSVASIQSGAASAASYSSSDRRLAIGTRPSASRSARATAGAITSSVPRWRM